MQCEIHASWILDGKYKIVIMYYVNQWLFFAKFLLLLLFFSTKQHHEIIYHISIYAVV